MGSHRNDWLQRLASISIRSPGTVVLFWVGVAIFASAGVRQLEVDTGTSSFLDRTSIKWDVYQESLAVFGGDEVVVVALEGLEPFAPNVLYAVSKLTDSFADISGVRRVDSVASVPVVDSSSEGELSLVPALEFDDWPSVEDIDRAIRRVEIDRIAPRNLLSEDGRTFAINVFLDDDIDNSRDLIVNEIEQLLGRDAARISGVPVFRTEVNTRTNSELAVFVPLTLLLVGIVVLMATQRFIAVGVSLGVSGVGVWCLLGAMGALSVPLSLSTMILPSILLALGCAYSMHILFAVNGSESRASIEESVLGVSRPIALSGLTTAIGFLAMSTVHIEAISQLGIYGSLGVVVVLFGTLTLVPALLVISQARWPIRFRSSTIREWTDEFLVERLIRSPRMVWSVWACVLVAAGFGLTQLRVETDIVLWFSPDSEIRISYEEIKEELSGITPVNVVISAGPNKTVLESEVLTAIHDLGVFLERKQSIGRVLSVADPLIQIHSGFTGLDGELPTEPALVSQYLLLLGSLEQLGDVLSADHQKANLLIRLKENGSRVIVDIEEDVNAWWDANGPEGFAIATTGVMYEFARAEEEIAYGQIRGLAVALGAISLILVVIFRNIRISVAAFVANLVPLIVTYGGMGLAGIPLDAATICIGSLAIGIGVDDTIHFSSAYSRERESGLGAMSSVSRAYRQVSPPLVFSTMAVAVGFAVLGYSDFVLIRNLGMVTSGMVLLCLVADFSLLPLSLVSIDKGLDAPEGQPIA